MTKNSDMTHDLPRPILDLADAFRAEGGRALLVGGCVRDMLRRIAPKDYDLEVYGVSVDVLKRVAESFGSISEVGRSFGILKLGAGDFVIDLGIPRKDSKVDAGHKGFSIDVDPFMTPELAAQRRDFTVNAIMMDPLTGEIIDPFHGVADLEQGVLRVVDGDLFGDDPLRVLRGMQFAARFALMPDENTIAAMKRAVPHLTELSPERFRDEWFKLLVLAERPSIGLQLGDDLGVFDLLYPEIVPLKITPQNPEWHPEGDVWIHTKMVVDEAAQIIRREKCSDETAFTMMLAALCHDFGKPLVTRVIDGKIRSIDHEEAGEAPARSFLSALSIAHNDAEKIIGIVKDHLKPTKYYLADQKPETSITDGAIRKLAAHIAPATIEELLIVSEADYFGRGLWRHGEAHVYPERAWLLDRAAKLNVLSGPAPHAITGAELIALGIESGPKIGEIIREADRLRDDEGKTKEEIDQWVKDELRWM